MKRVLQISNYLYPHIGGIEQVARDVANALSECDDIQQKIICFNEDAQDGDYKCNRKDTVYDNVDGVEVIRCGCFAKVASQSLSFTYGKELKKVMNEFKPDIVVLHYPNPFVSHYLLKYKKRKFKLILYWHLDITKQKILKKFFNKQSFELAQIAYKIVATSPNYIEKSEVLYKYKKKCIMIPNCISTDRLNISENVKKATNSIQNKYKNKILCFALGRHVPYKGMEYLVRSSKFLNDDFQICIGGQGPLTEQLKKLAIGDNKIEFLGRLSDEELIAYYMSCDIFCFPSITKNEAFGIALAEGMYFGKPAVTFTIPGSGVNYVSLNGVTGIECPNSDSKAYAKAIKLLGKDKELRKKYGEQARQRVIDNFTKEKFIKNVLILIKDI